ncbi:uncharacterized protein Z519_03083 [Cladophialophora bantiana CBS 173.52]|uniref:Uncharacterized protein n=1 Tax=Cladophialophora bantiana (strain ATCC 10958 / CBS 173.52 / CDC B-1940 / NIH 8579) TaxID=1442370 RepID=A0A0D2GBZ7_CLAB1|nr:uncharacterized protein Z519_03083 [Cladophialophora bantiana CBS 173.52]KIW96017.1 hypothetical protein Z519_03083 [Cladophialophora bantiana CBS 173.52]
MELLSILATSMGETVLHFAILDGHDGLVSRLLELNVDTSMSARTADSALNMAAFKGQAGIVTQLLEQGTDLELHHEHVGLGYVSSEVHGSGNVILWNKAREGHCDRPRYWSRVEPGREPLHSAACGGHSAVIDIFLQHGSDISSKGLQVETPLHVAASAAEEEVVKVLKSGANISAADKNGDTPLHAAAAKQKSISDALRSRISTQKRVLENSTNSMCVVTPLCHGADPTCENLQSLTPLSVAATAGHEDVVKTLIDCEPSHLQSSAAPAKLLKACARGRSFNILKVVNENLPKDGGFIASVARYFSWCLSIRRPQHGVWLCKPMRILIEVGTDSTYPLHNAVAMEQVEIVDCLL